MGNPNPIFIKLNRFIFFLQSPSSSYFLSSPSSSPSPPTNFFAALLRRLLDWLSAIPNLFLSPLHHFQHWLSTIPSLFLSPLHHFQHWLSTIPNLFLSLLHHLDQAFPPEARARCLTIAAFLAAGAAIVLLLFCFLNLVLSLLTTFVAGLWLTCVWVVRGLWMTCAWVVRGLWMTCAWVVRGLLAVCSCCGPPMMEMMKAPGTAGWMIARATFEAAPKAYFAALRAGQLVVRDSTVVFFPGA